MFQDHRPPSLSSSPDQYSSDRNLSPLPPSSPIYSFPRIQQSPSLHEDEYHLSWDPPQDPKATYSLPSFRSLFASDDEHPLTSEYDPSEYSEPDPAQDDSFLTESEDEEQDTFFSDTRVTFFTTSAERGRWKSEPRHALLRIAARTTSPAPSPVPSVMHRNISEPAPSTKNPPSNETPDPEPSSSPLSAPVSPAALSPISLAISPLADPVSPLSALEPLSPLSLPPSSLAGDHDMDLESFPDSDEIPTPMDPETGLGLFDSLPVPSVPSSSPPATITEPVEAIEAASTISSPPAADHVVPDTTMTVDLPIPKKKKTSKQKSHDAAPVSSSDESKEPPARTKKKIVEKGDAVPQEGDKGKKRTSQQSHREEGPKSKKARITHTPPEASGSRSRTTRVEQSVNRKAETKDVPPKGSKRVTRAADARKAPPPEPKSRQRKTRPRSPSPSASSSRSLSPYPEEKEKTAPEIDPELCGMLIECLATSRASSLPMSTLYKTVMQSYPSLKSRGTEHECLELMERILEGGTVTGGGDGVFGKVQNNGKDDSDPPLEAQWFYVPERDTDQDRAQLIRSMMPRPAKRSETKKYKQYYYRPLEKISRWDPEDEL
ncbi:hypothetical protein B0H17DRAFT_1035896 [Mycena rosella]|uniref:Uncharacterized protein n=1 Tax=Mycena rosella TaxID=1033263 RepID=A0AAD7M931_MYCRO|nr:hypothetical protein B0H17DRAFT_1035896 [Mycena rosella]